ncbi:diacylglycerol/lipid kinase family protein [Modestobacter roseus]|uniref:Diacylglycerol kinase family enzyme n=1 Tax=Modestobacter roseus TaxID=1181884 RepID=A0A562ITB1_9ACTN|nr:diacylglycerol kinase family protein [Modestobacter roseus]MQA34833.1 diacylglycerol kinase family lipid kinase [Modestobacter roseus]TWH74066.1 diacylglycerol kinase family enzyme [Modestobacter roseus]
MRALLVANPAATTTTRKVRDVLVRALSSQLEVEVAETAHRGHGQELAAQAATDGVDVVVTLGGDGTVNEAVNGLLAAGPGDRVPTLAVVPGGSTNVFSRALGRSRDPVEAIGEILDSLRAGRTRTVSLGTASARLPDDGGATGEQWTEPRWFAFAAGMGFDADVISRVEAQRERGRRSSGLLYVRAGLDAFVRGQDRRRPTMTLTVPGEQPVDGLFLALLSNVSPWTYLGSRPIDPSPQASFDTGLDVFAMGRVGVVRMLHHVRQVMAAEPDARGRGIHRWHDLTELTLTATRPQGWQLDGDHLGTTTGLRVRSVPDALRVVV